MILKVSFDEIDSLVNVNFIQTKCNFNTNLEENNVSLAVEVLEDKCLLKADIGEVFFITKEADEYAGPYDVIPRVWPQLLQTKDKLMIDNVMVEAIPLTKVINPSNGYTVTIG